LLQMLFFAVIGSFGTAYIHEKTGRDVRFGGLIGLVVGGLLGIFGLVSFWIWLYYTAPRSMPIRSYGARRRWYRWWE
jgi:hypothetical protein